MVGSKLSEREVFERMAESVDVILFVRQRYDRDPERQIEHVWVLNHQLGADGKPVYGELWGFDPELHTTTWRGVIPESIQDKVNRTGVRLIDDQGDVKFIRVPNRPLDPLLVGIGDAFETDHQQVAQADRERSDGDGVQAPSPQASASSVSEADAFAAIFGTAANSPDHTRRRSS